MYRTSGQLMCDIQEPGTDDWILCLNDLTKSKRAMKN